MKEEYGPFYFYKIFATASFLCAGICIVERSIKGAVTCFLLFTIIVLFASRKKKKLQQKKMLQKSP